jgi:hypothetical protein
MGAIEEDSVKTRFGETPFWWNPVLGKPHPTILTVQNIQRFVEKDEKFESNSNEKKQKSFYFYFHRFKNLVSRTEKVSIKKIYFSKMKINSAFLQQHKKVVLFMVHFITNGSIKLRYLSIANPSSLV